ncbi:MAG TPA: transaldolase [Bryobacteraceae bacterium]|nr:transaldolase [Bryobacteraceae bacterium]
MNHPLFRLHELGQSIWLDSLSRHLIRTGGLEKLVREDCLSGVTSNPTIFQKALAEGEDYDQDIRRLHERLPTSTEIFRKLAIRDIQDAADVLRPVYERTGGVDGYVSIEVSPQLAHDTEATIREARELWDGVSRPNVMVKIPGTREGLAAIERSTLDGININITLLFGLERYREVAEAYLRGLENRASKGGDISRVRSVASFFLSRIDVMIDATAPAEVRGKVAIASAKIAYQMYKEIFSSARFRKLEGLGARRQWLLWASTGTKNKQDSDVKYIEPLIGEETINTMPMATIEAYREHGDPARRLEEGMEESRAVLRNVAAAGIDLDAVTQRLEDEGVEKFLKSYAELKEEIERKLIPAQVR